MSESESRISIYDNGSLRVSARIGAVRDIVLATLHNRSVQDPYSDVFFDFFEDDISLEQKEDGKICVHAILRLSPFSDPERIRADIEADTMEAIAPVFPGIRYVLELDMRRVN